MAVLFSGEFNRRGHWQRIAIAGACGVLVLFSAVGLRGVVAIHSNMAALGYMNLWMPLIIAFWVLSEPVNGYVKKSMKGALGPTAGEA
jgi:hypothetical protein